MTAFRHHSSSSQGTAFPAPSEPVEHDYRRWRAAKERARGRGWWARLLKRREK